MPPANKPILPNSSSPNLVLRHPTPAECVTIWTHTSSSWSDSLPLPLYLAESQYLTTVPLAKDGGMTTWILVDKTLPPGERPILSSCESFWKHALISDVDGSVKEGVVHGVASVFCEERFRGRGYAKRMMGELARELGRWQTERLPCVGSILYSDIGKEYYAKLGWKPNGTNTHIEFRPRAAAWPASASRVAATDLGELCKRDEAMIRSVIGRPTENSKTRMTIIPNLEHMQWHIAKEDFACEYLFGKVPTAKGAIAGEPGNQVWALWTHRYYTHPNSDPKSTENVLYFLRLVIEADETATPLPSDTAQLRPSNGQIAERLELLKAVFQAAHAEAAVWSLDVIKMWNPAPLVHDLLASSGLQYEVVERQDESIASLLWYDEVGGISTEVPVWINNEHYAWC